MGESHAHADKAADRRAALDAVAPASVRRALARPGTRLDDAMRSQMQTRFGEDFSTVPIHRGGDAAASAQELDAAAYTAGGAIVFGPGGYAPQTAAGRQLLVHELAHVVQQRRAPALLPAISGAGDPSELAAEGAARGAHGPSAATAVPAIQRQSAAPTGLPDKPARDAATDDEIVAKLTEFLTRVQQKQGGQTLHDDPVIWQALHRLAGERFEAVLAIDNWLANPTHPTAPAEYAREARKRLPVKISKQTLAGLDQVPSQASTSNTPASVGDAVSRTIVNSTVAPIVKKLVKDKDLQKKIIDAAADAVTAGFVAVAQAPINSANLDPQTKNALTNAIEAAIKQKATTRPAPGTKPAPGPPPAAAQPQPPGSAAPSTPSPPGETITPSPPIPIPDTPDAPKPKAPEKPQAGTVEEVITAIAADALIPQDARGTSLADSLSDARDVGRALASNLDAAQTAKRFTVELTLSSGYRKVADVQAVFDVVEGIVRKIVAALPHHASNVGEVTVYIASADPDKPSYLRRVIKLH
jgi:hypothetical protein